MFLSKNSFKFLLVFVFIFVPSIVLGMKQPDDELNDNELNFESFKIKRKVYVENPKILSSSDLLSEFHVDNGEQFFKVVQPYVLQQVEIRDGPGSCGYHAIKNATLIVNASSKSGLSLVESLKSQNFFSSQLEGWKKLIEKERKKVNAEPVLRKKIHKFVSHFGKVGKKTIINENKISTFFKTELGSCAGELIKRACLGKEIDENEAKLIFVNKILARKKKGWEKTFHSYFLKGASKKEKNSFFETITDKKFLDKFVDFKKISELKISEIVHEAKVEEGWLYDRELRRLIENVQVASENKFKFVIVSSWHELEAIYRISSNNYGKNSDLVEHDFHTLKHLIETATHLNALTPVVFMVRYQAHWLTIVRTIAGKYVIADSFNFPRKNDYVIKNVIKVFEKFHNKNAQM